jgi:protein-S-isoprenylcysteine O-methyltransferase Ste14
VVLRRKLGQPIRGSNTEANLSIVFFALYIGLSLYFAWLGGGPFSLQLLPVTIARIAGYLLMVASVVIALASLWDLGDAWRVGVIEEQQTQLVQTGVYGRTRNPYFVAYLLMFAAYTVLLQNMLLLALAILGFGMIHAMVRREESHLATRHGDEYRQYARHVPRYLPKLTR